MLETVKEKSERVEERKSQGLTSAQPDLSRSLPSQTIKLCMLLVTGGGNPAGGGRDSGRSQHA